MTRDEILEAAAQIFSQKGFHAASMQDIAEAVHLQKASLYHHFPGKQDILVELLDRGLDMLIEAMQAVMVQPLDPKDKLRQAMHTYLVTLLEHREISSVLLLEHRSLTPELAAHHMPHRDHFERLWRDMIQEGLDAGDFACVDPAVGSRALLGVLNWTITWYRPEGKLAGEQIASQFADLFLCGLLARPNDPAERSTSLNIQA